MTNQTDLMTACGRWTVICNRLETKNKASSCYMLYIYAVYSRSPWVCGRWTAGWMNCPRSVQLSVYFISIAFLHIARRLSNDCFGDDLMYVLAPIVGQFNGPRRYFIQRSSKYNLDHSSMLCNACMQYSSIARHLQRLQLEHHCGYCHYTSCTLL